MENSKLLILKGRDFVELFLTFLLRRKSHHDQSKAKNFSGRLWKKTYLFCQKMTCQRSSSRKKQMDHFSLGPDCNTSRCRPRWHCSVVRTATFKTREDLGLIPGSEHIYIESTEHRLRLRCMCSNVKNQTSNKLGRFG